MWWLFVLFAKGWKRLFRLSQEASIKTWKLLAYIPQQKKTSRAPYSKKPWMRCLLYITCSMWSGNHLQFLSPSLCVFVFFWEVCLNSIFILYMLTSKVINSNIAIFSSITVMFYMSGMRLAQDSTESPRWWRARTTLQLLFVTPSKLFSIFLGILTTFSKAGKYIKCKKHLHHASAFCPYSSVIRSLFTWKFTGSSYWGRLEIWWCEFIQNCPPHFRGDEGYKELQLLHAKKLCQES